MARRKARRASALAKVSVIDLATELHRRRGDLGELQSRHDELSAELEQISAAIDALGGSPRKKAGAKRGRPAASKSGGVRRGGRKRPKNAMSLVEAMTQVLTGTTLSVTQVADAVQKVGYKTTSPSFRTIVNQALINSGKFKRVGRGEYTAK